jgi:HSP20 family protein
MANSKAGTDSLRKCIESARGPLPRGCLGCQISKIVVPVDMYRAGDRVIIKAYLAGFKREEVHTSITRDTVTIFGEHEEPDTEGAGYYCKEHRFGRFERKLDLPVPVRKDKAEIAFNDGVLTLTLPEKTG